MKRFTPSIPIPPGATIMDELRYFCMSQAELAKEMKRPKKTINEIIKGKARITTETAIQLERVLGLDAQFMLNLESAYRLLLARKKRKP